MIPSPVFLQNWDAPWLGRNRHLSKDYEQLLEVSEAMVYIAMVRLMLRRLVSASDMT
jgi:putative transposase